MECRSGRIGHCGLWWWRASWERMRKKRERDVMRERRGSYTLHQRWSSVSRDQHAIVISSPLPLSISPDPFTPPHLAAKPGRSSSPPSCHLAEAVVSAELQVAEVWPHLVTYRLSTSHDHKSQWPLDLCFRQRLFSNPTFSEETVQRSLSVIQVYLWQNETTSQHSNDLKL